MRVEFEGKIHDFPDDASEAEIQAMLGGGNTAPSDSAFGHYGGLLGRSLARGVVGGAVGLPALVADSVVGVGRDIAYGGKLALSKTGAVDAPDPKNYYSDSTAFPTSEVAGHIIDRAGKSVSNVEPEGAGEKIATGALEGGIGALTGSGVGSFLARLGTRVGSAPAQNVGRFLAAEPAIGAGAGTAAGGASAAATADPEMAASLPDWAPTAIGLGAGLGVGTAASATRAFAGHVPGFGSTRTGSQPMREALSNEIVQGMADDPARAAGQLRARTRMENQPEFAAPGYQELNTNAARDPGIATSKQVLGDLAGGALPERIGDNNMALTRAFQRQGADANAADNLRRRASDLAGQDYPRFGLTPSGIANAPEPADVTPFLRQLRHESDPLQPGTTEATRSTARDIRSAVRRVSEYGNPVPEEGAGFGPVQRFMAMPERLSSVRQDISESLAPGRPGAQPAIPSAANDARYTRDVRRRLDDVLTENTPTITDEAGRPMNFAQYNARQAGMRGEADQQGFLAGLMEKLGPRPNGDGARNFRMPAMSELGDIRRQDMSVPGGRNMSISRLSPERQDFLASMQNIGEAGNYINNPGTSSHGASTTRTGTTIGQIGNAIRAQGAPYEKVLDLAARNSLSVLGRLGSPGAMAVGGARLLGRQMQRAAAEGGVPDAVTAIRGRVGRFETDRPAAIEMLTGRTTPERGALISVERQAGRTARYGAQSFLAANMPEERRRRRPAY